MIKNKIWKIILKILLVVTIIAAIAGTTYLILRACGFTTIDDFTRLRDSLGDTVSFWAVIAALQSFQVVFIPISNQIITLPLLALFGDELWKVFLASWSGIVLGTICLYFIGKYGGEKLVGWVLGDKEKANELNGFLRQNNYFYPSAMLIPFIPDDVITTLAGMAKYSFIYVFCVSLVTRGVCTAGSVWGLGILTRYWWGWIIIAVFFVIVAFITVFLLKLNKKNKTKNQS